MGFPNVRRKDAAPTVNPAVAEALQQPGAVAIPGGGVSLGAMPGSHGDVSDKFYDDPVVNALAKLPSVAEAEDYTGAKPSFYGVQRPGDWQRVVQMDMAADRLPGGKRQLAALQDQMRERAYHQALVNPRYGLT